MILRVDFRNRAANLRLPEKRRLQRWKNRMSARNCPKDMPPPRSTPRVFRTNPSPEEGLSSVFYNCKMAKTHFCSYGLCRSPHLLPASKRQSKNMGKLHVVLVLHGMERFDKMAGVFLERAAHVMSTWKHRGKDDEKIRP